VRKKNSSWTFLSFLYRAHSCFSVYWLSFVTMSCRLLITREILKKCRMSQEKSIWHLFGGVYLVWKTYRL
jgi:hypothetical protein